jgi:hypothetical protein
LKNPTYATVATALGEAYLSEALWDGKLTVQGSADLNGIAFTFGWGTHESTEETAAGPRLEIKARLPYKPKKGYGHRPSQPYIAETWSQDDTFLDVATRMNSKLKEEGQRTDKNSVNWTITMRNLQEGLRLAITSQRDDSRGWRIRGQLGQLVANDWAITTMGIESRDTNDIVLSESEFPKRSPLDDSPWIWWFGRDRPPSWEPIQPASAEIDVWETLIRLGRELFPL